MEVNLNVYPYCHSFYQEIIDHPPEGVAYQGLFELGTRSYVSSGNLSTRIALFAEGNAEYIWAKLNKPSMRPALSGDLVHSERLVLGRRPYVTSFDHVGFLTDYKFGRLYQLASKQIFDEYLGKKRCCRLLPWSEAAAESFRVVVGDHFDDMVEVVYPAVAPTEITACHEAGSLNVLFIATDFYLKGGAELLSAYDELQGQVDIELTVVSSVPREVQLKYKEDEHIQFESPTFSRSELYNQFYSEADVLVHPTHNDSFGMVLLEAMNVGIPVVTTDVFAVPEIVEDGETGYVVEAPEVCLFDNNNIPNTSWSQDRTAVRRELRSPEPEVVQDIVDRLERLADSPKRRQALGEAGRKRIRSGKFSIEHRNARLRDIYQSCLDRF